MWYYTGRKCIRGHVDKRYTSNGNCYSCQRDKTSTWVYNNKEVKAKHDSEYSKNNRGKINLRTRMWYSKSISSAECRGRQNAQPSDYRARKGRASPCWLSEDLLQEIEEIYILACVINNTKLFKVDVDHVYPLNAYASCLINGFCGLHVPWNLKIIDRTLNRGKDSSKEVPDRIYTSGKT